MAAINPEDLEKLKKFIDFVSANPLILNVPQLGFLKRFIEKFGGKVPEGEYQMPAGGKCPFGGDAKTETKTQPPPTQDDDAAEPVVEEESEESEVELDMEETSNVQLSEPNVLYLDEKPPKIVKSQRTTKTKKTNKIKVDKTKHKKPTKKSKSKMAAVTKETATDDGDDPLFTMDKPIKMEIDMDKSHKEHKDEEDYKHDDIEMSLMGLEERKYHSFDAKELCETQLKYESNEENVESEDDDDAYGDFQDDSEDSYKAASSSTTEDEEDDDEPLIVIAKGNGRRREKSKKMPRMERCRDACKQKCGQKFTIEQRQRMCQHFWSLTKEEKKQYLRQHIRAKVTRYIHLKKKTSKSCFAYYLDGEEVSPVNIDQKDKNLIRVCRKYFESTLHTSCYTIKKALEGYKPEPEFVVQQIKKQIEEVTPQQLLDPETGDLITIDAKAKKPETPASAANEPKPKRVRVRRKPGDPLPKRYPKPIKCQERCIHKCHTKFTEEERRQICDIFWSMDYKRRKDYILARIEKKEIEAVTTPEFRKSNRPPRTYHTRFYLGSGLQGDNKRVCQHFITSTLSISQKFISNAINYADKNTGCYTGSNSRRPHNAGTTKLKEEDKQLIQDHIRSYPTWIPPNKKSKTKYLHYSLSIQRMYLDYKDVCTAQQREIMSMYFYSKAFHDDFKLSFLIHPEPKRRCNLTNNPNISHYTGLEPGGMWLDVRGDKMDATHNNPGESSMNRALGYRATTTHINPAKRSKKTMATSTTTSTAVTLSAAFPDAYVLTDTNSSVGSLNNSAATQNLVVPAESTTSRITQPQFLSAFNFNQSLSYAHLLDPALNTSFICQPPTGAAASAAATAASVTRHEFNQNIYDSNNLPHAHSSSTSSLFRRS
ncbi:uncharacterized protein isoform X4 [Musca autumnalis]|uniref:uncharacterized protein isoform X4 n=1 Tax=Musca autumnalis TaxID=221902 RepID=UPI003CF4F370